MSITTARKAEVIEEYATSKGDTGSPQVQIAILTERINNLSGHMQDNKKDFGSRRGLLAMVALRRKLLDYVKKKDFSSYQDMLKRLNIRR